MGSSTTSHLIHCKRGVILTNMKKNMFHNRKMEVKTHFTSSIFHFFLPFTFCVSSLLLINIIHFGLKVMQCNIQWEIFFFTKWHFKLTSFFISFLIWWPTELTSVTAEWKLTTLLSLIHWRWIFLSINIFYFIYIICLSHLSYPLLPLCFFLNFITSIIDCIFRFNSLFLNWYDYKRT